MYAHPATRANVDTLRGFGYAIVEPEDGPLASGAVGQGRLAELPTIVAAVDRGDRPVGRSGSRDPALRPPVLDPAVVARTSTGWHVVVTRRWHRRADRPGPLHRQSLERAGWASPSRRRRSLAARG